MKTALFFVALVFLPFGDAGLMVAAESLKSRSAFYPPDQLTRIRESLTTNPQGEQLRQQAQNAAAYWLKLPDEEVWSLMFGPGISRSWMVWSNGKCPSCTNPVTMYNWIIKAKERPWKVQCPHCSQSFPKNDFQAFYRSGLNPHGVFDPELADRTLLVNLEHGAAGDVLYGFGVDDGEGFVQGTDRWRFIGAYLVYGQFKQLVYEGIRALATAFVLTGDTNCARKAAILLDRVADVYPGFDYATQGLVYERRDPAGYVSVWHDACEETREMTLAYDQVFEAIREDGVLVAFLQEQARKHRLPNQKRTFGEIQRNIESGILRDALNNPAKMHSNFPRREIAYTVIKAVLGWPSNKAEVEGYIDTFVRPATAVDGVTGEKGLAGYSAYTISGLAGLLAEFSRADPNFLKRLLERNPSVAQTWRFHIDTFCLDSFYPNSGDCGTFAQPAGRYVGAPFVRLTGPRLEPSMYTFFWQLHEATGDPAYVQILYRENGDTVEGLPHDLCAQDPDRIRVGTSRVVREHGARPHVASVLKTNWHIGILRSGQGTNGQAVWLDYDAGGGHGHLDGMTLGWFALGRDLLPDFGYPPVQHGGWSTPQVAWYLMPASHNTVVVDGRRQKAGAGQCTLWAIGDQFRVIRAAAPEIAETKQFERTVALIDLSPDRSYVVDLFRVEGGTEHTKFVHGPKALMTTRGLQLEPSAPFGRGAMMRNLRRDKNPATGWMAKWELPAEAKRGAGVLRLSDYTEGAEAVLAESNIMPFTDSQPNGFWIPSVLVERKGAAPMRSVFVSTLEATDGDTGGLGEGRRVTVGHGSGACTNGCVALELRLAGGGTDVFMASAPGHASEVTSVEATRRMISMVGEMVWARLGGDQRPVRIGVCRSKQLLLGDLRLETDPGAELIEIEVSGTGVRLRAGTPAGVRSINREWRR